MRLIVLTAAVLAIAAAFGFGTAYLAVRAEPPVGHERIGVWEAWPSLGSRDIDPYGRASVARSGALPLAVGEGLVFLARSDDVGAVLVGSCRYSIGDEWPSARGWTLTVTDMDGRPVADPLGETGATSATVLRDASGRAAITVSHAPSAGNWLRAPEGPFRLVLRLYDSPLSTSSAIEARQLPAIRRLGCP